MEQHIQETDVHVSGRTVLIAMDGSKQSNFAFEWFMKNLFRKTDTLILAFCAEYGSDLSSNTAALGSPEAIRIVLDKHESRVKKVVEAINELVSKYKLTFTVERLSDPPGASIIQASQGHNADMIVCGSRGHGLIRRTLLGSVSEYIVHHSNIPVTVCKH